MTEAPNRVPQFVKPEGRVLLRLPLELMSRFPTGTNEVGSPPVPIRWMMVEPADYGLSSSTETWRDGRVQRGRVTLRFRLPPATRPAAGTVFLVHGYGVDSDTLFPMALHLAEAGWRSVLVDLRGHGASGGSRVYFGTVETNDLRELRRRLEEEGRVQGPYAAVGHSLGGAIALRWQTVDRAIRTSVALGSFAEFRPAAERLRADYVPWMPAGWVRRAVDRLPGLLGVTPEALDTWRVLEGGQVRALLVVGAEDEVTPPEDSARILSWLAEGSRLLIVGGGVARHELLPFLIDQHGTLIREWLAESVARAD